MILGTMLSCHPSKRLAGDIPDEEMKEIIIRAVEKRMLMKRDQFLCKFRKGPKVLRRHTVMYFLKKYTKLSLVQIAETVGITDHASVISALKKINDTWTVNNAGHVLDNIEQDILQIL